MKVAVERLPESKVLLDISTDEQEFEKALQRAYRKVVNQIRIAGFRPGKAPRAIVERMYGREMLVEQAKNDLLDPLYKDAVEETQIRPVGEPELDIYQDEPFAFKITVQVYPTIDLGDYQAVRAEPKPVEVTDEQVEETLGRLRESRSPWEEPAEARPAQEGDRVTVDVAVREVGSEEPYREPLVDSVYVLGKDNLFEQLRDGLTGMAIGESKTIEIPFAEDNEAVEAGMRGKTMVYELALKKIEEQQLLPLDDEFAGTATDGKITTLDALRADIRKDLLRVERQKARTAVGDEVVAALSELATLDLPEVMIDKQVDSDVENFRNHLGQDHNQTLEDHLRLEDKSMDQLREELRPEATRRLRNSLVLNEIATREGVSVGPQDIDAEIDRMVGTIEGSDQMRQFYQSNYVRNMLETQLFDRMLIDKIIDIATEGRGASDPPEEPEAEAATTEASAEPTTATADDAEAEAPTSEAAPERTVALDEAEEIAATEGAPAEAETPKSE